MDLRAIVETRRVPWSRTASKDLLSDYRYHGVRSIYEISGDAIAQLREYVTESTKTPVIWDRLLWDDPWEKPEEAKRVPLVIAQVFEECDFGFRRHVEWLLQLGLAIGHLCKGHSAYDNAWAAFSRTYALAKRNIERNQDQGSYVEQVMEQAQACADLRGAWLDFLDVAVEACQEVKQLEEPPVLTFLFLDLHLNPGQIEDLFKTLRKNEHPRLLCLFSRTV